MGFLYVSILRRQKNSHQHQWFQEAGCQVHAKATVGDITSNEGHIRQSEPNKGNKPHKKNWFPENGISEYLHPGRSFLKAPFAFSMPSKCPKKHS